jgi:hypothetical protein
VWGVCVRAVLVCAYPSCQCVGFTVPPSHRIPVPTLLRLLPVHLLHPVPISPSPSIIFLSFTLIFSLFLKLTLTPSPVRPHIFPVLGLLALPLMSIDPASNSRTPTCNMDTEARKKEWRWNTMYAHTSCIRQRDPVSASREPAHEAAPRIPPGARKHRMLD